VLLELYRSGDLVYAFEKIREAGMLRQMDFHSHTSQYGSLTRSARFADLDLEPRMAAVLRQIQDGTFAREWSRAQTAAGEIFARVKEARNQLPLSEWETRTREAFHIGDVASAKPRAGGA